MATEDKNSETEPVQQNQLQLRDPELKVSQAVETLQECQTEGKCPTPEVVVQEITKTEGVSERQLFSPKVKIESEESGERQDNQVSSEVVSETETNGEAKTKEDKKDSEDEEEESHEDAVIEENCELDANFSVVCSFFLKFGDSLGISYSIEDLKVMLEDHTHIHEELVELHIKLLRKRRKWINKEKWEKTLIKFVGEYNTMDAWELERFGYLNVKTSVRLELLKRLLEAQFDFNVKFKGEVNTLDAASLRLLPIGRDIKGNQFWYQLDADANIRIYQEMSDDDKSWQLVCKNREELIVFMEQLKSNTTLEPISAASSENVSESSDEDEELEEEQQVEENMQVKSEEVEPAKVKEELDVLKIKEEAAPESMEVSTSSKAEETHLSDEKCVPSIAQEEEEDCPKAEENHAKNEDCVSRSPKNLEVTSPSFVDIKPEVHQTEEESLIKEGPVNHVTNSIQDVIDSLLRSVEQIEEEDKNHKQSNSSRGRSGSRGGRGRGRARGKGRSSTRVNTTATTTDQDTNPTSKSSSRRSLSRELMELKGLVEQELLNQEEGAPRVRQSRRIAQIQEKKSAELAERMKQEQERMEAAAKRKALMVEERERKKLQYQERLATGAANGKSKGRKVVEVRCCLLFCLS